MNIRELAKLSTGEELDIEYPIRLRDKDGNEVYYERSDGCWSRSKYEDGREVLYEDSSGFWYKREYKDGNVVYDEDSNGCWHKMEYKDGKRVYLEDSFGRIIDHREPVDMTMAEVCKELGRNIRIVR